MPILNTVLAVLTTFIWVAVLFAFVVWLPTMQDDPQQAERRWTVLGGSVAAFLALMLFLPAFLEIESHLMSAAVLRSSVLTLIVYGLGCLRIIFRR